jgi:hypothetical protein
MTPLLAATTYRESIRGERFTGVGITRLMGLGSSHQKGAVGITSTEKEPHDDSRAAGDKCKLQSRALDLAC